jgi:hypothetical protein
VAKIVITPLPGRRVTEELSIHELRRRAPLHHLARAENARFAAYFLWTADRDAQRYCAEQIGYGGDPRTPMAEAFYREASLALELIIKAVVAQRIELRIAKPGVVRVRPTHDLVALWSEAELVQLPSDDLHRLMIARQLLSWSSRYAAPKKDEQAEEAWAEMAPLQDKPAPGSRLRAIIPRSFNWEDFDRLYRIAATTFYELRDEYGLNK